MDDAGFITLLQGNNLDLIQDPVFKAQLTDYYGIDFTDKERYISYLIDHAKDLTRLAVEEAIKVKDQPPLEKRCRLF